MLSDDEIDAIADRLLDWNTAGVRAFSRAVEAEVIERCAKVILAERRRRIAVHAADGSRYLASGTINALEDVATRLRAMKETT